VLGMPRTFVHSIYHARLPPAGSEPVSEAGHRKLRTAEIGARPHALSRRENGIVQPTALGLPKAAKPD
jgi:hypothetical protein